MRNYFLLGIFLIVFILQASLAMARIGNFLPKKIENTNSDLLKCELSATNADLPSPLNDSQKLKFPFLTLFFQNFPPFQNFSLVILLLLSFFIPSYWDYFRPDITPPPPKI